MSNGNTQSLEFQYSNFSSSQPQQQQQIQQAMSQISRVTSHANLIENVKEPSYDNYKEIGNEYHINLSYLIGQGNFGKVFIGYKIQEQNRPVACKVFEGEDCLNQLKQQDKYSPIITEFQCMQKMRNINCPYIVKVHSIKKTKQALYMFMDLCEGGNLNKFIQKKGYVGQLQSIQFFRQICKGFQNLYDNNIFIMHRDLKPENILIHEGVCKVADFGLSKIFSNAEESVEILHHTLVGTPPYMSPQILRQFIKKQQCGTLTEKEQQGIKYSNKCDIWSLGLIFYEMLTGKLPWQIQRNNLEDYLNQIENTQLYIPTRWCPEVKDIIQRMIVIDEEKRISWKEIFAHPVMCNNVFQKQYNQMGQQLLQFQNSQFSNKPQNQKQQNKTGKLALISLHKINQLILKYDKVAHFNKQLQLDSFGFQIELSKSSSDFITYENIEEDNLNLTKFTSNKIFNSQYYHHSDEEDEDYYVQYPDPPLVKKVKTTTFGDSIATNDTENQPSQYQQNLHAFQKKQQEYSKQKYTQNNIQQFSQKQYNQIPNHKDADVIQMLLAKIRAKEREFTFELNLCQFYYNLFTEIFELFKIQNLEFSSLKMIDSLMLYLVKFNIFKMKKLLTEIQKFKNKKEFLQNQDSILQQDLNEMTKGFDIIYFYIENQFNFYIYLYQYYNQKQQQETFFYQKSEPFLNKNFNFDETNLQQLKSITNNIFQELRSELSEKIKMNFVPTFKKAGVIKVLKYVQQAIEIEQEFVLEVKQYDVEDNCVQQFFDFYDDCENLQVSDDNQNLFKQQQCKQEIFGQEPQQFPQQLQQQQNQNENIKF